MCFQKQPREVFCKKCCLRSFAKFTAETMSDNTYVRDSFLIELQALALQLSLWHRWILVNFAKFLRTTFLRTPLDDCVCAMLLAMRKIGETLSGSGFASVCKSPLISWDMLKLKKIVVWSSFISYYFTLKNPSNRLGLALPTLIPELKLRV